METRSWPIRLEPWGGKSRTVKGGVRSWWMFETELKRRYAHWHVFVHLVTLTSSRCDLQPTHCDTELEPLLGRLWVVHERHDKVQEGGGRGVTDTRDNNGNILASLAGRSGRKGMGCWLPVERRAFSQRIWRNGCQTMPEVSIHPHGNLFQKL